MPTSESLKKAAANIRIWRSDPVKFVRDQFNVEPDEWQKDVLEAFASRDEDKRRISMCAAAGPGKLQPKSMMLYTPNGLRRWGDLCRGDYVFAEDGSATKILKVHDNGVMPMYRVTFSDGSSTLAGEEHLWKVSGENEKRCKRLNKKYGKGRLTNGQRIYYCDDDGYIVLTTKQIINQIKSQNYLKNKKHFNIPLHGAAVFPHKNLPIDSYVLGVWIGDGGRNSGRFTGIDEEINFKIKEKGYLIGKFEKISRTIYGIVPALRKLNLLKKYSYEKSLPEIYRTSSICQRIDLLRGLMDTDGCIDKDDGHCEFSTTSEKLAEDVVFLVRSLGGLAKIKNAKTHKYYKDKNGNKIKCRICYRVSINTPFVPFYLTRKTKRWHLSQDRYRKRYIDKIEKSLDEESMCIEVENKSKCYLANDFIVTHNSTVLAWCALNFILCYADAGNHPKGAAVSITQDNLRDNLWPEIAKWMNRSELLRTMFTWTKTRVFAKEYPETWFISARSWSKSADEEEQGRTLSGLHSEYVLYLIDESGDIPLAVLRSAEQGLTSGKWGKILQAGNPTSLDGMLYSSVTKLRDKWFVINITGDPDDSKRSPRIDIEWAREQIKNYGRDNPWVMSYILGKFPPSSINTLLGPAEVEAAMNRHLRLDQYSFAQKRLGIDAARFNSDPWCIFPRQGLAAFKFIELRNPRSEEVAARVAFAKAKWGSEIEFFDGTGGFASGAVDAMIQAGHSPIEIHFNGKAMDSRYFNKRSEMWFMMAEWVKKGGALPYDSGLIKELTTPTYTFVKGKFMLEEKEQIKKRLGFSPNKGDSLALTFALPEAPSSTASLESLLGVEINQKKSQTLHEFDPFDDKRI